MTIYRFNPIKVFKNLTAHYNKVLWLYLDEWPWLVDIYRKWKLRYQRNKRNKAIKLAQLRHDADGKRYYVLPDHKGNLIVLNNTEINVLKKAGILDKRVSFLDLIRESVYHTK